MFGGLVLVLAAFTEQLVSEKQNRLSNKEIVSDNT